MKNNSEAIEFARIYHKWIDYSTIASSLHTVRTYEFSFKLYIEFLEERKKIRTSSFCMTGNFSVDTIKEWLAWLSETRSCKSQSCNARFAAIRSFLKYAGEANIKYRHLYLEACCIPRLKESKRQVEAISKEAMKVLLQMPNPSSTTGFRDVVLFSFLYGTAARIDEVLSLKLKSLHLDSDRAYAVIVGKGDKMRTLFIQKILANNIRLYIRKFHGEIPNPNSYLFFSRVGGLESKLTQPAVNKRLKQYAKAANAICKDVPLDMHAHVFRHSCATHWLEDGMNIVQVSKLLGHASIATTMAYLSITIDMKTKAVMQLEDEQTRKLPKQWKNLDGKLSALFTRK
jgi:site-specific recombinase XerD